MAKRRKTGLLGRLWRRVSKGRKAKWNKLIPFETKVFEGHGILYDAVKQWTAAKQACASNPRLAAKLADAYRSLDHPIFVKQSTEQKFMVEHRQRDEERQAQVEGREPKEIKPRVYPTVIKPEDAANQLLVLGSRTPKPRLRRR